jgi:hypothetical protein
MHKDVLENTYRGNVTLKAADGERQSDESMAMAGLSDNRMVETGSDSEEPSPGWNRPSAAQGLVEAAIMGGEGLDDDPRRGRG